MSYRASMLIPREKWGAQAPRKPIAYTEKDLFLIHHSGADGWWPTPVEEKAAMWFWQAYHFKQWDAADIMYNAVVFPSGRAYEGRYGGWRANGGGAFNCNKRAFGTCLAGNYNNAFPTIESLNTLIHVGFEAKANLHIPPSRYWGHRDGCAYDSRNCGNDCPGHRLYSWLPVLRDTMDMDYIEPNWEEEEEMPELQLDRRGGDYGEEGYVFVLNRTATRDNMLEIVNDVAAHDFDVTFYLHPWTAAQYTKNETQIGGYDNRDGNKGMQALISELTDSDALEFTVTVHSPYMLHGGISR